MTLPYAEPLIRRSPAPRVTPEPPRTGDPDGPPCHLCEDDHSGAIWSDRRWALHNPGSFHVWFVPRPLGMLDARREMLPLWEDQMPPHRRRTSPTPVAGSPPPSADGLAVGGLEYGTRAASTRRWPVHRSRLAAIGIDVPAELFDETVRFWAGATGSEPSREPADDPYVDLGRHGGPQLFVQLIGSPDKRVHLDIETDDVEAEVERLEKLGAQRVRFVEDGWWILQDPAGMVFCVVPPVLDDFPGEAAHWD